MLIPDYDEGYVAVVPKDAWPDSEQARSLEDVDSAIAEHEETGEAKRLRRRRAASVFRATVSGGRLTVPQEINWLLDRDNPYRDVTLVRVDRVVEIWPSRRWQDHVAGHLFRGSE